MGKRSGISEDSTEQPSTKRLNDGTTRKQSEFTAILEAIALIREQQLQTLIVEGKQAERDEAHALELMALKTTLMSSRKELQTKKIKTMKDTDIVVVTGTRT
ncbi:hypothetical protein SARC_11423 [Sphaeroforma arctica JP610]|uniref:Uncharacterized protein n=1 Tax=Sphaeroforma arctica JP610 TaxID=667725 RepID=A0A0L0FH33_9EUKA|nr:hypothetical protein SARC_11423 [Sphaeroforma arctica JP610]KNC76062.1 hypothetical protein SARC_11423 [Sphaeroforma arctica JP610]|eukprot:XP_014149964.1 hypothetical protein SARC_11423 [Sphaeroforma arctica JP610]